MSTSTPTIPLTPSRITSAEQLPASTARAALEAVEGDLQSILDTVREDARAAADDMSKTDLIATLDALAESLPADRRWLVSQRPATSAPKSKWVSHYAMVCRATAPERKELARLEHAAETDRRADSDVIRLGQPSQAFLDWQAELLALGLEPVDLVARMAERVEDALRIRVEVRLRAEYLHHRLNGEDPQRAALQVQAAFMSDLLHRAARGFSGRQGLEDAAQVEGCRAFLRAVQWVLPVPMMV